ncbi:hypothetical protein EHT87_09670 [Larkinella knui]|uniref:DoxX family membrane protein n=1 Tax=Larkinella knui TaxID=2025310 RepID=A0A3P1CP36_9BACT|nr:hypothetical protein EHT87_09670 [Larkinella knui]
MNTGLALTNAYQRLDRSFGMGQRALGLIDTKPDDTISLLCRVLKTKAAGIMDYVNVDGQTALFYPIGRRFFGLGIAGIGIIHFVVPGLQPVIVPLPPEAVWSGFGYAVGAVLTGAGVAILLNWKPQTSARLLGVLLLLFLVFGHLPNRLAHHPEILGYWTDAIKLVALTGGAFALSAPKPDLAGTSAKWSHFASYGKYLYALMLILFGIDHFIYADLVKSMVPTWIPAPLFWTYLTGLALIGSGLSIVINFNVSFILRLLAIMLLLWLVLLHLPSTINAPLGNGNPAISSLECLAFSGIALFLSDSHEPRHPTGSRLKSPKPA